MACERALGKGKAKGKDIGFIPLRASAYGQTRHVLASDGVQRVKEITMESLILAQDER
jgi:hypothetical protein